MLVHQEGCDCARRIVGSSWSRQRELKGFRHSVRMAGRGLTPKLAQDGAPAVLQREVEHYLASRGGGDRDERRKVFLAILLPVAARAHFKYVHWKGRGT